MQRHYTLINDSTSYRHIGCDAVVATIRRAAALRGYVEVARSPAGRFFSDKYEPLLRDSELMVINGEGTLHDDVPACQGIAYFAAIAKERGKRVALVNCSYSGNSAVTTRLLSGCDVLAFRDRQSARAFAPDSEHFVTGDLSLHSFAALERRPTGRICFTDSVTPAATQSLAELGCRLGAHYAPVKDSTFYPFSDTVRFGAAHLRRYPAQLAKAAGSLWSAARQCDRRGFEREMQSASLLVTGRFHAVVFCLRNSIPFYFAPSNTGKIEWLLEDAGLDPRSRTLNKLESQLAGGRTPAQIVRDAAFSPAEGEAIAAYLQRQAISVAAVMDRVFTATPD